MKHIGIGLGIEKTAIGSCADCGGIIDGPCVGMEMPSQGRIGSGYYLLHRLCADRLAFDLQKAANR